MPILQIIQMPVVGQYVCRYEGVRNIGSTEKNIEQMINCGVSPKILINIHVWMLVDFSFQSHSDLGLRKLGTQ